MRIGVRVPATSANLGPGFDSFGMALELCNEVSMDTDATGVSWEGEGADELPTDGADLVSATMRAVADAMDLELPICSLHGVNRIPLARGLGSSAAAAVAGVVLASLLLDLGIGRDPASVTALAAGTKIKATRTTRRPLRTAASPSQPPRASSTGLSRIGISTPSRSCRTSRLPRATRVRRSPSASRSSMRCSTPPMPRSWSRR